MTDSSKYEYIITSIYLNQCLLLQIRNKAFVFVYIFYFVSLCVLIVGPIPFLINVFTALKGSQF